MDKVLVGGLPPEAEVIIQECLDNYLPSASIENLKSVGIKGKVKNNIPKIEVVFAIIDESLYTICEAEPSCVPILELPKVHKFVGIPELKTFLCQQFGLTSLDTNTMVLPDELDEPTDELDMSTDDNNVYIPNTTFEDSTETDVEEKNYSTNTSMPNFKGETTVKDYSSVDDTKLKELESRIYELEGDISTKTAIIQNLKSQLEEKHVYVDNSEYITKIDKLEQELKAANEKLKEKGTVSFSDIGKIAWAEQIIGQVDTLTEEVDKLNKDISTLETKNKNLESTCESLNTTLAEKEKDVETLNTSLSDTKTQLDTTISKLNNVTNDSKHQLEEKDSIIQTKTEELDTANASIESLKEDLNAMQIKLDTADADMQVLQTNVTELQQSVEELNTVKQQLTAKTTECDTLTETVNSNNIAIDGLNEQILNLQNELDQKEEELGAKIIELDTLSSDMSSKTSEIDELKKTKTTLETDINDLNTNLSDLQSKLDDLTIENSNNVTMISTLTSEKSELTNTIENLNQNIEDLTAQIKEIESQNKANLKELTESKDKEIVELQEKIRGLREDFNGDKEQLVSSMQEELDDVRTKSNTLIENLRTELENLKTDKDKIDKENAKIISEKTTQITKLEAEIKQKETELSNCKSEIDKLNTQLVQSTETISLQTNSTEELSTNNTELMNKLSRLNEEKSSLNATLLELQDKLTNLESENESLQQELNTEKNTNKDNINKITELETTITTLQSSVSDQNNTNDEMTKIKTDLMTAQRNTAQLQAELSTTKLQQEEKISSLKDEINKTKQALESKTKECNTLNNTITDLQDKVATLEAENNNKRSVVSDEDVAEIKRELVTTRAQVINLQTQLADKDIEIEEFTGSLFGQLTDMALPNVALNATCDVTVPQGMNVICVSSASPESNGLLYKSLREICNNTNKRCLILDLTTNSNIDAYFNIPNIPLPTKWLVGTEPFKNFVSNTALPNVKVISLALAYINDLYLLQVNWSKRLEELKDFAEIVVINVGCINNMVSKVLYNSFCKKMPSYAFVKATPINLRVAILNLTGIHSAKNYTKVICQEYQTDSKEIYATLAKQYKAEIYSSSKAVQLF